MQTKNRLVDGSLALKARQRAAAAAQPKTTSSSSKGRKIAIIIAIVGILVGVGAGGVWAWKYFDRQAKLSRLAELREKMKDPSLSDEDRRAMWSENRELMDSLPRDQRRSGGFGRGGFGRGGQDDPMKKFFAMTPAQQVEQMNKDIDAIMAADAARKARQAANAAKSKTDNSKTADSASGADSKNGGQTDKSGDNSQGGPRTAMTDAQKQARRDSRLSSTPPAARAERTQGFQTMRIYRNMLNNQALTRGITLPTGGGPGGGGFGGGGRRGG